MSAKDTVSSVQHYELPRVMCSWLLLIHAELINEIHHPTINRSINTRLVSTNCYREPTGWGQVSGRVNGIISAE